MNQRTWKAKRNQTTRRILKAAAKVFSDVGFDGARVDEIARVAGVNKAMIYYHIGDKEALYAHVIHDVFGNVAEQFTRKIEPTQSPEDKLRTYIRTVIHEVDQHPELAAIMLREQASGAKNLPDMIGQDLARIVGIITDILDEGAQNGVFIETIPFLVHMMVIGTVVLFKMSSPIRSKYPELSDTLGKLGKNVSEKAAEEIERLVLNAVKKQR
jgi:AcrR family transcriptional regulator